MSEIVTNRVVRAWSAFRGHGGLRYFLCVPVLLGLAACATSTGRGPGPGTTPSPTEPTPVPVSLETPPDLVIEAVVTGRDGRPYENLRASDFEVTVDGRRRLGVAVARLYRGPGADFMARQHPATLPGEVTPLSEPTRTVIVAIDQASLLRGEEPAAREAAEACMALLGISDKVGVVALPLDERNQEISVDRARARETLSRLRAMSFVTAASMADEEQKAASDAAERVERDRREASRDEPVDAASRKTEQAPLPETMRPATLGDRGGTSQAARAAARSHAASTLDALRRILRSVESEPGGKTILFLSAGLVAVEAESDLRATIDASARAHARVISLRLPTASPLRNDGVADLQRLAEQTGGSLVTLTARPQRLLERLAEQLSQSYLLLLAPARDDAVPGPHAVRVQAPGRKDVSVQAPAIAARGRLRREDLMAALSPAARAAVARPAPEPPAAALSGRGNRPFFHDHAVDLVLARVSQYVSDYGTILSSLVSEERYVQEARGADGAPPSRATLVSDFLTVKIEGSDGWLPFRDVFEVDGRPVRDRQDRITRLFMDRPSAERLQERGNALFTESARYNIGTIVRTLNIPTLPLWFLEPASTRRFAFRKAREETLNGRRLWVLEFGERLAPTFIKTPEGGNLPSWGSVWVDPLNGAVHKTELHASIASVTTTYGPWPGMPGVWLPLEMRERYVMNGQVITGEATYTNFRQFQVRTEQEIHLPKK